MLPLFWIPSFFLFLISFSFILIIFLSSSSAEFWTELFATCFLPHVTLLTWRLLWQCPYISKSSCWTHMERCTIHCMYLVDQSVNSSAGWSYPQTISRNRGSQRQIVGRINKPSKDRIWSAAGERGSEGAWSSPRGLIPDIRGLISVVCIWPSEPL